MPTLAPTYVNTYTPTTQVSFREKRGALSKKLFTEFDTVKEQFQNVAAKVQAGLMISAATLRNGPKLEYAFSWQAPYNPCLVDHIVVHVGTAGGTANAVLNIGRATCQGVSGRPAAARLTDPEGGASRPNMVRGWLLNYASHYDTRTSTGWTLLHAGTVLTGAFKWINGRIVTANAGTLAGTVYVFYHKSVVGS